MIKSPGVAWRLLLLAMHLLLGVAIVAGSFAFISMARQERVTRWWSRLMLAIFGISAEVSGVSAVRERGHMLLINHVSWIDVYLVNSYRATRFVAKSEIRDWPLLGWLCAHVGTMFIERAKRRAVHAVLGRVEEALREGACVGIFPEGTTTDGSTLLPFHANLIEAAIVAGVPVIPATLHYRTADCQPALAAAYIGEMSLLDSAGALLRARPLRARLVLYPAIETRGKTRHDVAREAREVMLMGLDITE